MFLQGNSSLNIKDGSGLYSEKAKQIVNAILNNTGAREESSLGKTTFAGLFAAGPNVGVRATASGVAGRQPVVVVETETLES